MKILLRILLLYSVFFFVPSGVFAWGKVEHQVTARIAWENLTPETRKAVVELMLRAPADAQIGVFLGSPETNPMAFFINASFWADQVRGPFDDERAMKYSCRLWHYAEFTFGEPGVEVPDLPAFKPRQVNVLERLQFFQKVLVDENEPIANRAVELLWTIHLVADIHQPLHIASRITKLEPEGDLGGNKFRLEQRLSLHSYWDMLLTRNFRPNRGEREDLYIKRLAETLTKKYSREDLKESLAFTKPEEWASESFDLARSVVYSDVSRDTEPSEDYRRRAIDVGQRRIALAGYRLAQMLNRLFGSNRQQITSAPAISENAKRIKARLDYDLACVASTLDAKTQELTLVKGTALAGAVEGRQVQGFDSGKIKGIISETRQALLTSLAGEELAGLRAWAIKNFPDVNSLETIKVRSLQDARLTTGRKTRDANHSPQRDLGISLVPGVNYIIGKVHEVIQGARRRSGPIRLQVITNPQGANIFLQAPGGKRYETSTNSSIPDFFPGTYSFKVIRDGSLTIEHFNVDLGFGNSVIECPLVSSGTPRLCTFKQ